MTKCDEMSRKLVMLKITNFDLLCPTHRHRQTRVTVHCRLFTVNILGWRLRKLDTYSINFDSNANKCPLASILESP